jgi:hypothetical protein
MGTQKCTISGFVGLCFENLVRGLFCSFVLFSIFLLDWVCSVLISFIKITYSLKKKKWITYSDCFYLFMFLLF